MAEFEVEVRLHTVVELVLTTSYHDTPLPRCVEGNDSGELLVCNRPMQLRRHNPRPLGRPRPRAQPGYR